MINQSILAKIPEWLFCGYKRPGSTINLFRLFYGGIVNILKNINIQKLF
jgi:hypothetical protein